MLKIMTTRQEFPVRKELDRLDRSRRVSVWLEEGSE